MTTKTFSSAEHQFTFKAAVIPQLRTDRLLDYLTSVGVSDTWLTKNVQPLLKRWAEPREFFDVLRGVPLTSSRATKVDTLEKLLKNLFRHQVRDWLEAVESSDEENTPARDIADEVDYWTTFAGKYGKALLKVRAIQHEGTVWFRLGDVAEIAKEVTFDTRAQTYVSNLEKSGVVRVDPKNKTKFVFRKTTKAVRLFTRKELTAVDGRAADEGTRKGDWYVTSRAMKFIIGSAARKSKEAEAFLDHVLDVLDGEAESIKTFTEKKVKVRSAARQTQLKVYPKWKGNVEAHGANLIDANGEVFYHVTDGEYNTQEAYCAEHGIDKPFAEKLPDEIIQDTNLIREVTMKMADTQRVRGKYAYSSVIARAADAVDLLSEHPEALAALAASKGISHTPRFKSRAR